jgi:hypothetical protein
MVVHDKVYDCTSFVDEHPYVFSFSYFNPPPSSLRVSRNLFNLLNTFNTPPKIPTLVSVWYHKSKTITPQSITPHQHKATPLLLPKNPLTNPS